MDNNYTNIYGNTHKTGIETSIDLSQIEKVQINGQEYLKFIDSDTKEIVLMENLSNDSLQIQFEKIRDYYSIKMGNNGQDNTNKIIDFKQKYDSKILTFVKITDLNNNFGDYEQQLAALNKDQRQILRYLIVNCKNLKIDKINIEKGIALDKDGKVIETTINPQTREITSKTADTTKVEYSNNRKNNSINNQESLDIGIKYTDDQYMEYPELLEREYQSGLITLEQKSQIEKRMEFLKQENKQLDNSSQKKYVYQLDDRKAGFLDTALFPAIIIIIGMLIILSIIVIGMM